LEYIKKHGATGGKKAAKSMTAKERIESAESRDQTEGTKRVSPARPVIRDMLASSMMAGEI
jgi:hypothetical protein